MRIVTTSCPECGTIVAGNVLARVRTLRCPGVDCDWLHRFDDLPEADRKYVRENYDRFFVE